MSRARPGYRESHAGTGYGSTYERTYQTGYYRAQWEEIERPLLLSHLTDLRSRGATSLLDFACGTGRVTVAAESVFPRVVGVDISEPMLAVARQTCRSAELVRQDLTVEPLAERFDVATAFRFFLNAEPALRVEAARAIFAALRPGGALLANVHVNEGSPLGVAYRIRNRLVGRHTASTLGVGEMEQLMRAAGFQVESITWYSLMPRVGWLFPPGSRTVMKALESLSRAAPAAVRHRSQSFLVRAVRPQEVR